MLEILLVDDEVSEREGISYLIKKYKLPLNISEAKNGKIALEHIKSKKVDILFTDVEMPHMNGLELAKEIHKYNKDIKIIVFSAHSQFEYAKKALEANAVNYLLKPIEVEEFKSVMMDVIKLCEDERNDLEYRESLEELDRKMFLYKLITGGQIKEKEKRRLKEREKSFYNNWIVLINVETQKSIFAENEGIFIKLVKTYMPYDYEYINIYPHSAYLILTNSKKMNYEKINYAITLINRDIRLLMNDTASFIIGQEFDDINRISEKAEALNTIRNEIYDFENAILFEEKIISSSGYYTEDIEKMKNDVISAIEDKEFDKISVCTNRLIKAIAKNKSISKIYVSNVFYDLMNKIHKKFGLTDKTIIHRRIESLIKCRDGAELEKTFQIILEEIAHNYDVRIQDSKSIAKKVIRIIESEYMNDLNLDYIANEINFAPAYLSYVFKKETGSNVIKYITDYRMEKAKRLLEEGKLKIIQVAQACGYGNQSYFNRLFKNYYGVTPKQFKEKSDV